MGRRLVTAVTTTLMVALSAAHLSAQSLSFGIMAGGSLSKFTGNTVSDVKQYAGFIAGGFVRVGLAGFAVQPGIFYTSKGSRTAKTSTQTATQTELDYIQIPVVLRLGMGPIYVGAGPAIGFKTGCKISITNNGSGECAGTGGFDAKSTETSGIVEAGLAFGKFSLGARADLGLSNVYTGSNIDVKTQTVSAVAAIRF